MTHDEYMVAIGKMGFFQATLYARYLGVSEQVIKAFVRAAMAAMKK